MFRKRASDWVATMLNNFYILGVCGVYEVNYYFSLT
jgi:hypothetical protein